MVNLYFAKAKAGFPCAKRGAGSLGRCVLSLLQRVKLSTNQLRGLRIMNEMVCLGSNTGIAFTPLSNFISAVFNLFAVVF